MGAIPNSFAGTLKGTKPKKQRTAITDVVSFYARDSKQADEGGAPPAATGVVEVDVEDEEELSDTEDKQKLTGKMSIQITQEVFIPRIIAKRDMDNVGANVIKPKQPVAAPPPEEFLDFAITDTIVKVQGRDNWALGKVLSFRAPQTI